MDGISVENLKQLLKAAIPPLILSLRRALGEPEEPRVVPGAVMRDADCGAAGSRALRLIFPVHALADDFRKLSDTQVKRSPGKFSPTMSIPAIISCRAASMKGSAWGQAV